VNEVANTGVDGEMLRARVDALLEITGGCIAAPPTESSCMRCLCLLQVPHKESLLKPRAPHPPLVLFAPFMRW
jgi:hypothetical protein